MLAVAMHPEFSPDAMHATAPVLAIEGLSKRFGPLQALSEVGLDLHAGDIHCLLGENGAGKSTLCNAIFGLVTPDSGRMLLGGRAYRPGSPRDALKAGVAMVHQHFSLVPELTVVENLCLSAEISRFDRRVELTRLQKIAAQYGIALESDARVADLSVGERQRIEILKCLIHAPKIVVLDEPTAVLPPAEIADLLSLIERMASEGNSVLLVTHKLAEIEKVARRITVLRRGRVTFHSHGRPVGREELTEAIIGHSANADFGAGRVETVSSAPGVAQPAGGFSLMLDGVSVSGPDGMRKVDNVTILVRPGEIVGVAGVEGNGQTELGLALAGLLPFSQGRYFAGNRELTNAAPGEISSSGVAIIPEDRHAVGAIADMTVAENLFLGHLRRFCRGPLLNRSAMDRAAAELIGQFDVRCNGPRAPFSSLSGGNQQKVVLARELTLNAGTAVVASQPTRGLDIGASKATYAHLRGIASQGSGVLVISSELDDLMEQCDRLLVMYRGAILGEMPKGRFERSIIGAMMSGHLPP